MIVGRNMEILGFLKKLLEFSVKTKQISPGKQTKNKQEKVSIGIPEIVNCLQK